MDGREGGGQKKPIPQEESYALLTPQLNVAAQF